MCRGILFSVLLALLALGSGCATPPAPRGDTIYERTFNATKDIIREARFDLARVDAARGVITTRQRASAGYLTPWVDHADSFGESVEGTVLRERRIARVRFRPDVDGEELAEADVLTVEFGVEVLRVYEPGRRLDPNSIRLSSVKLDPAMRDSGLLPTFAVPRRTDLDFAERLAERLRERLGPDADLVTVRATSSIDQL
jgi:hypothetical protein